MGRPIELTGVLHGKTITLDKGTFLPDGCRVIVHLHLTEEEGMRILNMPCEPMTEDELKDLEDTLSELRGRPLRLPEPRGT